MDIFLNKAKELKERIEKDCGLLRIDDKRLKSEKFLEQSESPDFWNDPQKAAELLKKKELLDKEIGAWDEVKIEAQEISELYSLFEKENNNQEIEEIKEKLNALAKKIDTLEFYLFFSGKYDREDAILSIHAGAGGVDAQDWAEILERMYFRFAEKNNYKSEILDETKGSEAGIKSLTAKISGPYAYGRLKSENGVHRLVRISPFDAEAMRHTSFASVEIIPVLPESEDIEINEKDLRIDVFRSSGPGGQGVNTTDSAVRITHLPTNISVSCQCERSQHQNKESAMKILKSKLFLLAEQAREAEEKKMRGEPQKIEWGKQIRSYVMQPYKLVKDHRTDFETVDIDSVLDGNLDGFIEAYLRYSFDS